MEKATIKKECRKCGRVHYEGRSCIKKKPDNSHNIYSVMK